MSDSAGVCGVHKAWKRAVGLGWLLDWHAIQTIEAVRELDL